ncbi:Glycosyl transferases group 1 [Polystyrenella longa]|uniref:Glycosyl transferases group 1 n=1 Tax=Polystyrenella longa TaxID=2528007 RepID=A0A518CID3_9PLAN|nr:glycosyltransferase [Polystyrenella longa]QDU78988.1 Glycosyl transferases group 1 [Polystyrenella longa]
MRLLQVCNVGNIVGGTAACTWSVVRALPDCEHVICFRSPPTRETSERFNACAGVEQLLYRRHLSHKEVMAVRPDLVLMHNIGPAVVEVPQVIPSVQYVHSQIQPMQADFEMNCSHWLTSKRGQSDGFVCWQGVPLTARYEEEKKTHSRLTIGRICTPTVRKWPQALIPFYALLARKFPEVLWEFIGCPMRFQPELTKVCKGEVLFREANWDAREHVARWDAMLYHHPDLTESFGRTVAEAMRVGTIPIVDDRGGFVEQINSDTGFLCHHPAEFELAIEMLQDIETRQQISQAGMVWANANFSIEAFRQRLLGLLQKL